MSSIAKNIDYVRQQINFALNQSKRKNDSVCLLAVSKTRKADDLRLAYQQGQSDFGENYLQESLKKIHQLSDLNICWHFIGTLQSNKTSTISKYFDWVHTVDRFKLARRLSEQRPADAPPINICIQVNISQEINKSGCAPTELFQLIDRIMPLPKIRVRGLMAIPKATDNLKEQQEAFAKMQLLYFELQKKYPQLDTLSMGMSGDMQVAIAYGSTMVRIGTAIFGERRVIQKETI